MTQSIDSLMLPTALWGTAPQVSRAWSKITRAAWTEGSWSSVEAQLEFCRASDRRAQLYLTRLRSDSEKELWRLYMIGEAMCKLNLRLQLNEENRFRQLLLEGMDRLWFVAGVLDTTQPPPFEFSIDFCDPSTRQMVARAYLEKIVRWLDELVGLTPFLSSESMIPPGLGFPVSPEWWSVLFQLARYCEKWMNADTVALYYAGDLIQALIGEEVIVSTPEGYKVAIE